jgi:hypothetical protein
MDAKQGSAADQAKLLPVTIQSAKYILQLLKLLPRFCEFSFSRQALIIIEVLAGFGDERIRIR